MARRILADDQRQLGESVETGDRDHAAAAVDQLDLAAMLPQRHRLALDKTDVERIWQAPLDQRRADPGQAFELFLGPHGVDRKDRGAGPGAKRSEDRLAIGRLAALDPNVGNPKAERRGGVERPDRGVVEDGLSERRTAQLSRQ